MSSESASSTTPDFCDIAARLGFLTAAEVEAIRSDAVKGSTSPAQVAIRRGLLDTVQVDSIETLLHPTDTVPGYEILDLRGRGGMGVVYRARHLALGRIVALKTVLVSRAADANALSRFEQEARLLAQLRHHNIVSIHDFGKADGRLYFAMEYVEGTDVDQMIAAGGPVAEKVAWGLARQVAAGLSHAAKHGVVHRDIKPANLLLVDPPEGYPLPAGLPMVKIADFGLALLDDGRSQTRLTTDTATLGSPQYMAPEQFAGSRVDLRADMYALGTTLYHMLAGRPPFSGRSLAEIAGLKMAGELRPLDQLRSDLHPRTHDLIRRLTSRDPDGRPGDYDTLIQQIDSLLPLLSVSSSSVPVDLRGGGRGVGESDALETRSATELYTRTAVVGRQPRRRPKLRWLIGAATLLLLLLLAVGIISRFNRLQQPPQPVPMEEIGNAQFLFNGGTIVDWTIRSGSWSVPPGDAVIRGENGLLARTIFKNVDGAPVAPLYYRLVVFPQLHEAEAAELHFGLEPVQARNGPRYVVRITRQGVELGERPSDSGEFRRSADPVRVELNPAEQQAVVIERLPTGWFVKVNGRDVGSLAHHAEELPEFRLAAIEGAALFSDVELVELVPMALHRGGVWSRFRLCMRHSTPPKPVQFNEMHSHPDGMIGQAADRAVGSLNSSLDTRSLVPRRRTVRLNTALSQPSTILY
ncbi:MAG: serine/threonine protein kinase [Planctomycetota bacterium]|nr:MAG: serine/threonine protein kinase [Planctomycetota bacterium]